MSDYRPEYSFSFSEEVVEAYTKGDCWLLSAALYEQNPALELWAVGYAADETDDPMSRETTHYVARNTNGKFVDVLGVWDAAALEAYWAEETKEECQIFSLHVEGYSLHESFGWPVPVARGIKEALFPEVDVREIANKILAEIG